MTESQIERIAEQKMDQLDRRFLRGELTEEEYSEECHRIERWAHDEYQFATRI